MGLREYSKSVGVTTVVTAAAVGKEVDEEMVFERINSMPPNVVNVETEYVREVCEVSDIGLQRLDLEKKKREAEHGVKEQQIERTGSEDDLFRR